MSCIKCIQIIHRCSICNDEITADKIACRMNGSTLNTSWDARTYSREQLIELRERINEAFLLNPYGKVFHVDRVEPNKFDITVDV